jgi:hypothetical protein
MAPNHFESRLSDVESHLQKHQLIIDAMTKDARANEDDVAILKAAVFGDMKDPDRRPGLIADVRQIKTKTDEIYNALKWLLMLVVTGIVGALLALIFNK